MRLNLAYGRGFKTLEIPDGNVAGILYPKEPGKIEEPFSAVRKSLENPMSSPPLQELLEKFSSPRIVIIVNDVTRRVPYNWIMPPLMEQLGRITPQNIEFVVATGIHRPHTHEENQELFTAELVKRYNFTCHNCDSDDLANLGPLSDGTALSINRKVYSADFICAIGVINLHYLAGYSGGRKSILPGISSREAITRCHARMADPMVKCGQIIGNPVHEMMMEAARKSRLSFIINIIISKNKDLVQVVSGDMEKAWLEGLKTCADLSICRIERKYPVIIVSAAGYPKDINVYQAHKALNNAAEAVEEGATIILLAECAEGFGERTFEEWMSEASRPVDVFARFRTGFTLGGHKAFAFARIVQKNEVILISSLSREKTERLFCKYEPDLPQALKYVQKKHGKNYEALVMPEGESILPRIEF
jgi:nickel-dependent lactate racemase